MPESDEVGEAERLRSELAEARERISQLEEDRIKLKAELGQMEEGQRKLLERMFHLDSLIANAKNFALYRVAWDPDKAEHGRVIFISPSFLDLWGFDEERANNHQTWFNHVHPDDLPKIIAAQEVALTTHQFNETFRIFHSARQEWRWIHAVSSAKPPERPGTHFVNGVMEDVTEKIMAEQELANYREHLEDLVEQRTAELAEANRQLMQEVAQRKKSEERLTAALQDKEVLLREVHHRVKNNLQNITSLLDIQAAYAHSEQVMNAFEECRDRIRAMCMVHQQLYRSDDLTKIELGSYLEGLTSALLRAHGGAERGIELNLDAGGISLELDQAIPCGLTLNELIINSIKHAFPHGGGGKVSFRARLGGDGQVVMTYSDDGVGLPAGLNPRRVSSLGLSLVQSLVEHQLGGKLEVLTSTPTTFDFSFPLRSSHRDSAGFVCEG